MNKYTTLALTLVATLVFSTGAWADFTDTVTSIQFVNPESGNTLEAEAVFDLTGTTLTVTLTNISTDDSDVPTDLLSGVFWDVEGTAVTLTKVSAILNGGSTIINPLTASSGDITGFTNVGGEYGFNDDIQGTDGGAFGGAQYGTAASGFGVFSGNMDISINGTTYILNDLDSPQSPDGANFNMLSAGWVVAGDNAPLGASPLIFNSVVFTYTVGGTLTGITNVGFQYGTSQSEPFLPPVPEPLTLTLLGIGLAGVAFRSRRRQF